MKETFKRSKVLLFQTVMDMINVQRLLRFGITGVLTTTAYFLLLIAMVEVVNLHPVWAAVVAYCVPLPLNYLLHRNWSFESNAGHSQGGSRYLFTILTGFCLNTLIMYVGTTIINFRYLFVQIIATGTVIAWNYISFSVFVFHRR